MTRITSLSRSSTHTVSKTCVPELELLEGLGVAGDAHMGITVKHQSRVAQNPDQPNLRQVHLIHAELLDELAAKGYDIAPGAMGENILTSGVPLLELPLDTELQLGDHALIRITGLRNPCAQLDKLAPGLMKALLDRAADGSLIRKGGIMAVVLRNGIIRIGDGIQVRLPAQPYTALDRV
jgi:MOSC domain-containing protein YiiM